MGTGILASLVPDTNRRASACAQGPHQELYETIEECVVVESYYKGSQGWVGRGNEVCPMLFNVLYLPSGPSPDGLSD